jgi:Outer membrane protein beta-barrel domain
VHIIEREKVKNKFFLIAIVLFIFSSVTNAQLIFSYGLKVGMANASQSWNYSGPLSDLEVFDKSRIGLDIGIYSEWFNFPVISILTELHYIQKGCKDEFVVTTMDNPDGIGETRTSTPRIDYISVPILAKIRYNTKPITFYGIVGPRLDILIGKNSYAMGAVFDDLKKTDFGGTFGIGLELLLKNTYHIGSEFRYSFSSQTIFSNQWLNVKNKSLEFLLVFGL